MQDMNRMMYKTWPHRRSRNESTKSNVLSNTELKLKTDNNSDIYQRPNLNLETNEQWNCIKFIPLISTLLALQRGVRRGAELHQRLAKQMGLSYTTP